MSIRKIWLYVLMLTVILSILINAALLTTLTDRSFQAYLEESYTTHLGEIEAYALRALESGDVTPAAMNEELETHLVDPIIGIRLLEPAGGVIAAAENDTYLQEAWIRGSMMERMMYQLIQSGREETHTILLTSGETTLGELEVIQHSSTAQSMLARMFKASLWRNSVISIFIALILSGLIGILISRRMSRSLQDTARYANGMLLEETVTIKPSRIHEVNQIRESLNGLLSRLKLKQTSRRELTDQLLHQSRTPLTILRSHLEALEDGLILPDAHEYAILQQQVEQVSLVLANMDQVIDALTPDEAIQLQTVDLSALLEQVTGGMRRQFENKQIAFEVFCAQQGTIQTDPHLLSGILYNLLTNAYKYTDNGGHVQITCRRSAEEVILTIRDDGRGIERKEIEKIFNAYYRGARTGDTPGEGIGLYLARRDARRLGGTLRVESIPDRGSDFQLRLPIDTLAGV